MNFPGKNLFFNQKVIALISLVLFSFLLVGALRMVGLYEGLESGSSESTTKMSNPSDSVKKPSNNSDTKSTPAEAMDTPAQIKKKLEELLTTIK